MLSPAKERETSDTYDEIRMVDALPDRKRSDVLKITLGYAVCIGAWYFFEDLPPALVFGRAARMSNEVSAYSVHRAAREARFNDGLRRDERFLWFLSESLDRHDDEADHFRTWIDGTGPKSSHWSAERARRLGVKTYRPNNG